MFVFHASVKVPLLARLNNFCYTQFRAFLVSDIFNCNNKNKGTSYGSL